MKKILMADLKDCYDEELLSLISKACFLDPRFKALAFMTESDRSCIAISIKEEAQDLSNDHFNTSLNVSTSTVNLITDDEDASPPKKTQKSLMSFLNDVVCFKSQDD